MKVAVPDDLMAFLTAGQQLVYDPSACEAGKVHLVTPARLRETVCHAQTYGAPAADQDPHEGESGTYAVPGVDLIASCSGEYDAEGLLAWFPGESRYGTVDTSHDYVLLFSADVRWADIVTDPVRYLNAQWAFEGADVAPTEVLAPWHRYPWRT